MSNRVASRDSRAERRRLGTEWARSRSGSIPARVPNRMSKGAVEKGISCAVRRPRVKVVLSVVDTMK